jgi:hypothetical protein
MWRYDVGSAGSADAHVALTYDWSAVAPELRQHTQLPPFGPAHLENSLKHLSDLAAAKVPANRTLDFTEISFFATVRKLRLCDCRA